MRIVIVANSQGTAAGSGAGWLEEGEEYPELIRRTVCSDHEVVSFARSGWSIRDFLAHAEEITDLRPDLVVVQIGIVECTQRILSEREKAFFYRLRGGRQVTRWLHDRRNAVIAWRRRLGITTRLVPIGEFAAALDTLAARLTKDGARLLFVEIPRFGTAYERAHFPGINRDIAQYNAVIRAHRSIEALRADDDLDEIWQPGTVHLTREGHCLFATRMIEAVGL